MQSGSTPSVQDQFKWINTPRTEDMELQLQQLVQQGVIDPEQAATILQNPSAMNQISSDPSLKQNQMDALLGLQDISDSGGLTSGDQANLSKIRTDEDTAARGKREAIIQNAQSRGLGGSGLELMSQMQNQQDSATRNSQRDMDVAGQAQERALQALMQQGQLSGQIQNQDFNQQAQKAQANDAISQFNAQNQQAQINQNVGARNAAQAANLGTKQNIANSNVATANTQQQFNKGLIQQQFDNQIKKAGGSTGVDQANAQAAGQNSANQANATNQLIGIGATAAGTYFGGPAGGAAANAAVTQGTKKKKEGGLVDGEPSGFDSEPHMLEPGEFVVRKEDVPDMLMKAHTGKDGKFDAAGFLDSITGHKYGYKKGAK
jgi:hypothetical protein